MSLMFKTGTMNMAIAKRLFTMKGAIVTRNASR